MTVQPRTPSALTSLLPLQALEPTWAWQAAGDVTAQPLQRSAHVQEATSDLRLAPLDYEALQVFAEGRPVTAPQLTERMNISGAASRLVVANLSEHGLVAARSKPVPATYALRPRLGEVIVLEILLTRVIVARCDLTGRTLAATSAPMNADTSDTKVLAEMHAAMLALPGYDRRRVWAVCVSIKAPVASTGVVVAPPTLKRWRNTNLCKAVGDWFADDKAAGEPDMSVTVVNDSQSTAYGCYLHLADDGRRPRLILAVEHGDGIGVGLVRDGDPVRSAPGDLGHTQVDPYLFLTIPPASLEGLGPGQREAEQARHAAEVQHALENIRNRECRCETENKPCLAAHASGWAMAEALQRGRQGGAADVLRELQDRPGEVAMLLERSARALGVSLASLVSLLAPQAVVLSGALALERPDLHPLRDTVAEMLKVHTADVARQDLDVVEMSPTGSERFAAAQGAHDGGDAHDLPGQLPESVREVCAACLRLETYDADGQPAPGGRVRRGSAVLAVRDLFTLTRETEEGSRRLRPTRLAYLMGALKADSAQQHPQP